MDWGQCFGRANILFCSAITLEAFYTSYYIVVTNIDIALFYLLQLNTFLEQNNTPYFKFSS